VDTNWPTWGDARLETGDPVVRDGYLAEMSSPFYFHAPMDVPEIFEPVTSSLEGGSELDNYE